MRICYVVDYRSPIAQSWIAHFAESGHEVHVVSTFPVKHGAGDIQSLTELPVNFTWLLRHPGFQAKLGITAGNRPAPNCATQAAQKARTSLRARQLVKSAIGAALHRVTPWTGSLDVIRVAYRLRQHLQRLQPDLIHAMRLPFEGILAARAAGPLSSPTIASVWGNDFTLFARKYPLIGLQTRAALQRMTALHTDCQRDARLARAWGLPPSREVLVMPGNGGVRMDLFAPGQDGAMLREKFNLPVGRPIVLNPRNIRRYVRNDVFFRAAASVAAAQPDVLFACVGMLGNPIAESWARTSGISGSIRLLPSLSQSEMACLFSISTISVSPATHDGTPNTLLEGMAAGTFPVAGDIASLREWITPNVNGLLVDPAREQELAHAILTALADRSLRSRAASVNRSLIRDKASYETMMQRAEALYERLTAPRSSAIRGDASES